MLMHAHISLNVTESELILRQILNILIFETNCFFMLFRRFRPVYDGIEHKQ